MNTLAGTGGLLRLILRRDRWLLPAWILPLALIPVSYVTTFANLFPTAADLQRYAETSADNAGFVALYGKVYGSGLGELSVWRAGFMPAIVGLISLLIVIRHTRTDEEAGRRELLGATVVGRHANLFAAVLATCAANLVLGVLLALAMSSQGLAMAGSLAFGLQLAASGWVFAGVGAVAAQLTAAASSARGIAVSALGAAYLLRVAGDVSDTAGWLSWLSPIGWVHRLHPYGGDRWWVAVLPIGLTVILSAVAVALSARRDIGAGLLPPRPGPAYAAPSLRSPLALAWRLHRGLLAAWTAGFAVLGLVFGGVANGVGDLFADNKNLQDILARVGGPGVIIDAYLAAVLGLMGLIVTGYAIQAMLRLRAEETAGRAEPVLATAAGRIQWLASHAAFAIFGPAVALLVGGLAMGLTYGIAAGEIGRELPRVLGGAAGQLPAVWVLTALAIALVGLLPRFAAAAAWAAPAICLLIMLVGGAVRLNQWLLDVSPYTHLPRLPGGVVTALPLATLTVLAVGLAAAGVAGIRRRDIPVG